MPHAAKDTTTGSPRVRARNFPGRGCPSPPSVVVPCLYAYSTTSVLVWAKEWPSERPREYLRTPGALLRLGGVVRRRLKTYMRCCSSLTELFAYVGDVPRKGLLIENTPVDGPLAVGS